MRLINVIYMIGIDLLIMSYQIHHTYHGSDQRKFTHLRFQRLTSHVNKNF